MSYPTILEIVPGSPAAHAGLAIGDELLAVNGIRPSDVIEYQQLVDEATVDLDMRRGGLEYQVEVGKDEGEPLGLRLSSSIFDRVQTCDNHCEFCFIYQLPSGMRKSLYLKDDDYRLSFLYGNFTTLTRFTELDLVRVIDERLGPLYVSIHATDPEVRSGMLRNPRGATSLRWLRALLKHGIEVHGQVVLCPEVNGGDVLASTCAEIIARYPGLASVGIVPLGKSAHDPSTLVPHTRTTANRDLDIIEFWQERALERIGKRMFFASDELYLMAHRDFPPTSAYEEYAQHENGIGMARALYDEIERLESGATGSEQFVTGEWRHIAAAPATGYRAPRRAAMAVLERPDYGHDGAPTVLVTGEYGARVLGPVMERLERLSGTSLRLLPVPNSFFGGNVAVAGLITGADLKAQFAADSGPAATYLVPDVALRGDVFLDGMSFAEAAAVAPAPVRAIEPTASALVEAVRAP